MRLHLGKTIVSLLLCFLGVQSSEADILWTANVNLSYVVDNRTLSEEGEIGVYGHDSPVDSAYGLVVLPKHRNSNYACPPNANFSIPQNWNGPWIALIQRGGGCTFSDKINAASIMGAKAVVIYNNINGEDNEVIEMSHPGTKDTVAIMIGNLKGKEIVNLVQNGLQVTMLIEVGKKHGSWINHYSIFFVSISFFVVTAATVGYFIFYSARRWRRTRVQNQKMKQLKDEAKKAISHLQLRTIKQGDMVLGPDGDSCAVCIETYKPNDVVRVLTCNHFFHKNCIDPWLLEHRTCPMCKCDILKSLGIAEEDESDNAMVIASVSSELQRSSVQVDDETRSDNASSGYASVREADEPVEDPENTYENVELVNNDSIAIATDVLPHADNPTFESENPSLVYNVKS
ncbi:PREDICTED: E3 ubiquitin-protein ligase RNF128 isoform X2 [Nanorana parkeri]|uniref:E3 ubiquitin-protein ligase RNF128 isoform X2 n=1 Tax=Nanorana parkeri TaxID=125878 RepID=UPI0008544CF0|nr:PREDICTED: E3 ubiquitin-protein ligase RNF128 isoform X2 [Nanorana parkeri]